MHFHPAQLANCRSWVHPDKQVVVLIFHSGGSTPLQEMMTYSRSKPDLKRHRNTPEILVWRYFLLPEVLQPWLKSVKTNNYNKDTSQFPIVLIQRSVLCFQITFKCNVVTHFEQRIVLLSLKTLFKIPICSSVSSEHKSSCMHFSTFLHSAFSGGVSLSAVHLTDLDHVFVCRGTLDSVGDVDNRGIYSDSHHLHGHGHGFSGEDGSVQNLRVLKTEKAVISIQVE